MLPLEHTGYEHAPFRTHRVWLILKPTWLTEEIQDAIILRDDLLKFGRHLEYKEQRNKVNSLKRKAKKKYSEELVRSKHNRKAAWSTINQIDRSQGSHPQ